MDRLPTGLAIVIRNQSGERECGVAEITSGHVVAHASNPGLFGGDFLVLRAITIYRREHIVDGSSELHGLLAPRAGDQQITHRQNERRPISSKSEHHDSSSGPPVAR